MVPTIKLLGAVLGLTTTAAITTGVVQAGPGQVRPDEAGLAPCAQFRTGAHVPAEVVGCTDGRDTIPFLVVRCLDGDPMLLLPDGRFTVDGVVHAGGYLRGRALDRCTHHIDWH